MKRLGSWTSLWIVLAILAIVSCGGVGDDPAPPSCPDVTGLWFGTYSSGAYSTAIDINITYQSEGEWSTIFSGEWKHSYSDTWSASTEVDGYTNCYENGWNDIILAISSGPYVLCPSGGAGHEVVFNVFGRYDNGTIIDDNAYHGLYCAWYLGTMTLTKL